MTVVQFVLVLLPPRLRVMEAALVLLLVIASSGFLQVQALPGGAPVAACVNLTPNPVNHVGERQESPVPYSIDLAPLGMGYTPGQTYIRKESLYYVNAWCFQAIA